MRTPLVVVLALAVLVGVGALILSSGRGTEGAIGPHGEAARSVVVLEGTAGGARNYIEIYEPKDGAVLSRDELLETTFRWASVEGAERYLFVANDELGSLLWRSTAGDTTITLPAKVVNAIITGERLKWIVQAPHLSASTDVNRVEVR